MGPSLRPDISALTSFINIDSSEPIRTTLNRRCLLTPEGEQRSYRFPGEGQKIGTRWTRVKFVLPLPYPDSPGNVWRPNPDTDGPFLRLRHALVVRIALQAPGFDEVRFAPCVAFIFYSDTNNRSLNSFTSRLHSALALPQNSSQSAQAAHHVSHRHRTSPSFTRMVNCVTATLCRFTPALQNVPHSRLTFPKANHFSRLEFSHLHRGYPGYQALNPTSRWTLTRRKVVWAPRRCRASHRLMPRHSHTSSSSLALNGVDARTLTDAKK